MNIGILGTGIVGTTLADAFIALGHQVKMGSRDAHNQKAVAWASKEGINASHGTFAEAAKFGEIVVAALNWAGTENALQLAGPENLAGKIVIDTINPLKIEEGKPLTLEIGLTDSAGESVQRWLPDSHVVKAFNMVGAAHMFKPNFPGGPPDMFIAGNDAAAKQMVTEILTSFGWPTIDAGGIEASRELEAMCVLWVSYAFRTRTFGHAFKLLRK